MINKKGLWFLTLFSLILILSVYYVTMPSDMFKTNNSEVEKTKEVSKTKEDKSSPVVEELTSLEVMREESEDTLASVKKELEEKISSTTTTTEEKNQAYVELKEINDNRSLEASLEEKLKNKLEIESLIKKENENIVVTVEKKDHNKELALQIMKLIQEEFKDKVIVSVKFIS